MLQRQGGALVFGCRAAQLSTLWLNAGKGAVPRCLPALLLIPIHYGSLQVRGAHLAVAAVLGAVHVLGVDGEERVGDPGVLAGVREGAVDHCNGSAAHHHPESQPPETCHGGKPRQAAACWHVSHGAGSPM